MSNKNDKSIWEQRYQEGTTGWDRGKASPNLSTWLEQGDLQPCRILIPGCGNGYEILELASRGFEVVAVDIAASPIRNAKKMLQANHLQAELIESDLFALDFRNTPFDAIYEQTCLCALEPTDWQAYEQWLYDSLKEKGKLYAHFLQNGREGGPPYHCDMTAMKDLFDKTRWTWEKALKPTPMSTLTNAQESPFLLIRQ